MNYRPSFIPTIDISEGQAVLVRNGKVYKKLGDPMEKAKFISINTHLQVVDIDAAMGVGSNKEIIQKICKKYPCYVGGGIRTYQDAIDYLNSSARRVIVSTALSMDLINQIKKDRLIVAFDIDEQNRVFKQGRGGFMDRNLYEMIREYGDSIEMMTITFHQAEGTCKGIPMDQVREIVDFLDNNKLSIKLVVAGGLSDISQIRELIEMDVTPQFGSGFWNGKFTLGEVFETISKHALGLKSVDFNGMRLIPTIVQSIDGQVLGQVFSTPESVKLSADTRVATFYSRDGSKIWIKGATSGNHHKVISIHYCCDGTSLRFVVDGNKFCHTGSESCFGHTDPARASLRSLQRLLKERYDSADDNSYTRRLLNDRFMITSKVLEEAEELVCATEYDDIVHESADLVYFTLMLLQKQKVNVDDVESELIKRRYTVFKDGYNIQMKNSDKFKIGVILANMPTQFVFEYLENLFNTKITKKTDSPRCMQYLTDNEKIMIITTKPKDVSTLINNGFLDAVVSFEDIIVNYSANVTKLPIAHNKTKTVSIVVAVKNGVTLESLQEDNKKRKLVIMAEYVKLTSDWVTKNNLKAKIVHVSGSSEGYLLNDLCDMCVVVYDSGTTLKENDLVVLDTLVTTGINLFVHPNKMDMLYSILK